MGAEEAAPDVLSERPGGEDRCSSGTADRDKIIEGSSPVEHRHETTTRTKHPCDLRLGGQDVGNVVKNPVRKHQVEALILKRDGGG